MANNINWMGNPVVDRNASNQASSRMPYQSQVNQNIQGRDPVAQGSMREDMEGPPMLSEPGYIPYFLRRNIGRNILAEFIINNAYIDKAGKLVEVGINYFVLENSNTNATIMCDLYSVKFVDVLN